MAFFIKTESLGLTLEAHYRDRDDQKLTETQYETDGVKICVEFTQILHQKAVNLQFGLNKLDHPPEVCLLSVVGSEQGLFNRPVS